MSQKIDCYHFFFRGGREVKEEKNIRIFENRPEWVGEKGGKKRELEWQRSDDQAGEGLLGD